MTEPQQEHFPPELVCPAVTADVSAFRLFSTQTDSYRRDSEKQLQLLMIRRGIPPFEGMWALPGGFLRADETIQDCAYREVEEETGIIPKAMIPIEVFSRIDRDPRGRCISHAFAAVISDTIPLPRSGTDARQACWFDIGLDRTDSDEYRLLLSHEDDQLEARLSLREVRFGGRSFDILENSGIAFDHSSIIAASLSALRELARYPEALLDLVQEPFTLAELQKVQETITGNAIGAANFRRKIAEYVQETDDYTAGSGHRPARLFVRKKKQEVGS